jgi:pimeloyl-ACP methyl ester carboxylesterase
MTGHKVNGTLIRTAWISKLIERRSVLVLPDDMDVDSTIQHELFGPLFGKLPIFCIDTMHRDSRRLEFGEPIPIDQQVDEACQIVRSEGIERPIWFGDCARATFACRAASRYPGSHLILSAPLFTDNGMRGKLSLLRKLLHTVVKNGDIASYTLVNVMLTLGAEYVSENPFCFTTVHRRHRLLSIDQRQLMLSHCFPDEADPENVLEDVTGKIMIISGTDDTLQSLRLLKQRIEDLQNCTHKLYECGHTVIAERRGEYLNDVLEFWRQVDA